MSSSATDAGQLVAAPVEYQAISVDPLAATSPPVSYTLPAALLALAQRQRCRDLDRFPRRRSRALQRRVTAAEQAQRLLATQAMIYGHFRPRRHWMTAARYLRARAEAFRVWQQETRVHETA